MNFTSQNSHCASEQAGNYKTIRHCSIGRNEPEAMLCCVFLTLIRPKEINKCYPPCNICMCILSSPLIKTSRDWAFCNQTTPSPPPSPGILPARVTKLISCNNLVSCTHVNIYPVIRLLQVREIIYSFPFKRWILPLSRPKFQNFFLMGLLGRSLKETHFNIPSFQDYLHISYLFGQIKDLLSFLALLSEFCSHSFFSRFV